MAVVKREGELSGLASMIADLLEGNLLSNPDRVRLLGGVPRKVSISATDLGVQVGLTLGRGEVTVGQAPLEDADLRIYADSSTLLDLPSAKLLAGLPSFFDPVGRSVTKKMLKGELKVKGIYRIGLLSRVQRLLSVN